MWINHHLYETVERHSTIVSSGDSLDKKGEYKRISSQDCIYSTFFLTTDALIPLSQATEASPHVCCGFSKVMYCTKSLPIIYSP